jgi:hypothetical protein
LGVGLANGNKTYIWSQTNVSWASAVTGAATYAFVIFKWNPRGEQYVGTYSPANLNLLQVTGYIRFEVYTDVSGTYSINPIVGPANAVGLTFTINGPVFRHLSLVEYENKASTVEKIRVLSAGFLFTNTTPAISRGGKIAAKQFPGDEPWYEFALGGYDSIAKLVDADLRDATNGLYAFLLPTTVSDFEMTDFVDYDASAGALYKFAFDLDSVRSYLGYYAVMPSATGQSAQFVGLTNIEFESDDQWYGREVTRMNPKAFEDAVHLCSEFRQFYENPEHVKDIMNKVKSIAKTVGEAVVKYGPTAIEIGTALAALL